MTEKTKKTTTEKAEKKTTATRAAAAEPKKTTKKTTEVVAENKGEKADKKFVNPFSANDPLQAKFVNCIMSCGKKTVARKILHETFAEIARRGEKDVLKIFEKAIQNTTPTMECRPKRVGGAVYQIPMEVKPKRQMSLPIRWLLAGARSRKGQPMYKRLAAEIMDAANAQGIAFNKREDAHRAAQANKAFAHLARY